MYNKTKPRSNQQAFNRVWRYFVIDGHEQCRSETHFGGCSYRGSIGEGCAVGCMMPYRMAVNADKQASSDIESVMSKLPSVTKWFSRVDLGFLEALQHAHDKDGFDSQKSDRLKAVATQYGLTIPKH